MGIRFGVALATMVATLGCHPPSRDEAPSDDVRHYDDPKAWLCRPDRADDACHGDLDATEVMADGSLVRRPFVAADGGSGAPIDCFYIYPTVDLDLRAGNHTDFADVAKMRDVARAQIARYREVCNVYAPLYRQMTIGTYLFSSEAERQRFLDVAYSDIIAAFRNYLANAQPSRKLVIIGHSQGGQLATRLLHDAFDGDDPASVALRARLVVGMPIGFDANTPTAAATGGSFDHLPPCTTDAETGCIVGYRSIAAGDSPSRAFTIPPGRRAICVNPAGAGKSDALLTSVAPSQSVKSLHVDTPYVIERGFYKARCAPSADGRDYLEISEAQNAGDQRKPLVDLGHFHGGLGLHIFDLQFPQGDLIHLIAIKGAAMAEAEKQHR